MSIPPAKYSDEAWMASPGRPIPDLYRDLRRAADVTGHGRLSLGMSGDLALAIAAGSDCVRIGTAILASAPCGNKRTQNLLGLDLNFPRSYYDCYISHSALEDTRCPVHFLE